MAKKSSEKIWDIFVKIWLVTAVIYFIMVLKMNISFQATIFMWITTMIGCLFYVYAFYRKNRVLAVFVVISMLLDIWVAWIRWLPWVPRLCILVPFIIWAIGVFWYTKTHGKKSMWALWIIFLIFEILSIIISILWVGLVSNVEDEALIFCHNDIPYVCNSNCDIDWGENCECAEIDKELLWDYKCEWRVLKLFDTNWQLVWTFWESEA
jgi:hypothetical protein